MMKRLIAVVVCTCLFVSSAFALEGAPLTLTVQGSAAVTAQPDLVSVTACVSLLRPTAAEAQSEVAAVIARATDALTALGIQEDDIITLAYSFFINYNYESETPELRGYSASHTLSITCRDVNKLDAMLSALTDCGVNEMYSIEYDVSNRSELYRQALCDAMQVAAQKAEQLAAAAGCTSVKPDTVKELGSGQDAAVLNTARSVDAKEAPFTAGIHAGSVSVTASVEATFVAE